MMNNLGKMLVLLHTVFSIACMTWAMVLVMQGRDFGWAVPANDVVTRRADGTPDKVVHYASEFDKSIVHVRSAIQTRDHTMKYVQPALDSLRATEPYLPGNHLFYVAELKRLKDAPEKIEVKRLQGMGLKVEPGTGVLGKPIPDKVVAGVEQSYATYTVEMKKHLKDIEAVEKEIQKIVKDTRALTGELTGTDDNNDYVYPGLYQMIDMEFKAQTQFKIEIDDIKPHWSKAVENARRFQYRRLDLEATLEKLTAAPKK